ncbi:START-like domain-containing protein [Hymenobacter rubripertinctus]|uniref:ATPase n=1 Tax=Hymenobacter rubripertinctus TaxID=2029981 RepID=A0A418R8H9_9BACT|nr:START-like domain-containing protein [Hymenobacter rubripertinctus]RIY13848.1 ATPase [Hymenobacter rubripertinctus]
MPLSATRLKHRFLVEYPINASPKILYPYLATASGLEQWFCQSVKVEGSHLFNFVWDNQPHYAEMASHRTNRSVRFVFLDDDRRPLADANYLDFLIEESQLTQEVYLRVLDYSEETDTVELREMWDSLMQKLREQVGG